MIIPGQLITQFALQFFEVKPLSNHGFPIIKTYNFYLIVEILIGDVLSNILKLF